ncbi:hypothetical protein ZYGR_0S01890 [Zygosaccharomyces rouxii]|uniref:ZYRO0F06710p n=2 Tax=Zygosaccharomyces rouxii TaxID=4956 RepID=C5DXP5_ZYGRC|nr:uncharacterized protein ZYRO0F06710g [Zygosaccharomyces rouxii]KAH9199315.1 hypothetical protein LQ764DRAFT_128772 [Zygosaccharomyces rouxii]GAV50055.1 hypothetical protein ZYGR_0S01890 [Zygosaccharomyces rouxii]CAR28556.1 ZYRO0F06710p [Zygosaccharomyces rouxii]
MEGLKPYSGVDVPVDWLYRGKKLSTKPSLSRSNSNPVVSQRTRSNGSVKDTTHEDDALDFEGGPPASAPMPKRRTKQDEQRQIQGQQQQQQQQQQQRRGRSVSVSSNDFRKNEVLGERSKKSLFGSIFHRGSHTSGSVPNSRMSSPNSSAVGSPELKPQVARTTPDKMSLAPPPKAKPVDPLEKLSKVPMKRVSFAVDKFSNDPPQQLPSRRPRPGNVMVPEDMVSEAPAISLGITNNGASAAREPRYTKDSREYKLALENQKRLLKESAKHQQEAHMAAKHMEHEVTSLKNGHPFHSGLSFFGNGARPKTHEKEKDTETELDARVAKLSIDKPIHVNEHPFQSEGEGTGYISDEDKEITLDVVYTRCCHLREILPIPSTLRQVTGKSAPLQVLKFLNPRPTLIDILSFCDFISVVPINTVVFDKVSLTPEMFQVVMVSLVHSKALEKLSLRNVVINREGWRLLCKFLMINKSITKLNISQTRIRSASDESKNRDQMDWPLFSQVLRKRRGRPLEELLLNGVRFDKLPSEHFCQLITAFAEQPGLQTGIRLGVAASEINLECMKFLLSWMSKYNVQGVDLGYNDLSAFVKVIANKLSSLNYDRLEYFTLNSSCLSSGNDLGLLLKYLATLPRLKFLDISNLPQCFPEALTFLHKYLPKFPQLSRIHVDSDNLSFKNLSLLCTIFPKCRSLNHVSIQGQALTEPKDPESSEEVSQFTKNALAANLLALVKNSPNLVNLDVDYDEVPDAIRSRIALTLMHNMNKNMDSNFQIDDLSKQDELLFDGSLLAETAETILDRLDKKSYVETDATKRYLTKKYFEQTQHVHSKVQTTIDKMFDRKKYGELPLKEKENLLRLVLLEKNLANVLDIFAGLPDLSKLAKSQNLKLQIPQPYLKHVGSEDILESPVAAFENPENAIRPHLMASDSGKTIDVATGKPVLFKKSSTTSLHSKRQEQEEGELHKWGFYVQQRNAIYPESDLSHEARNGANANEPPVVPTPAPSARPGFSSPAKRRVLPKIPSGSELREAIIKAKGIDSINDLINDVEEDRSTLENIYGRPFDIGDPNNPSNGAADSKNVVTPSAAPSTNSHGPPHDVNMASEDDTVQETYEKLLNNYSKERTPK